MTTTTAAATTAQGLTVDTGRLNAIVDDLQSAVIEIMRKHRVTHEEYRAATVWLMAAGTQHLEIPLMLDVFLAQAVDDLSHGASNSEGTDNNVEGPVYVEGAPMLTAPYVLPQRENEPGTPLLFSGTVRACDGTPLAGAVLDIWQANGAGEYSHYNPDVPEYNLRGKLTTDADGAFEFSTVTPSEYPIPLDGATGQLLAALGRPGNRPAHIHFKLSHPDAAPLTTQLYFADDPYLRCDVVGAVKDSLVLTPVRSGGRVTCSFNFVLTPAG
jgi:catechol 1,2-dioxygenase